MQSEKIREWITSSNEKKRLCMATIIVVINEVHCLYLEGIWYSYVTGLITQIYWLLRNWVYVLISLLYA